MNRRALILSCRLAQGVLGLSVVSALCAANPEPARNPASPLSALVRSEFVDDPKIGKDPFFPNSSRRQAPKEINVAPLAGIGVKLKLSGISGPADNRLVIINNKTYGLSEEFEVKQDGQTYKVRIDEIKDRSVIVNVNGLMRELSLGQSF